MVMVVGPNGTTLAEFVRTTTAGLPVVGGTLTAAGERYVVLHVSFNDAPGDDGHQSDRIYSYPIITVRPEGSPPPVEAPPAVVEEDPVLPLAIKDGPLGSGIVGGHYLPGNLIALLVWCGYRTQATFYKGCLYLARELRASGHGWFIEATDPARLYRLRKRAKANLVRMELVIAELAQGGVPSPIDDGPSPSWDPSPPPTEPPRGPSGAPPPDPAPRSPRPLLRLVEREDAPAPCAEGGSREK